jgi:hypothetical protein
MRSSTESGAPERSVGRGLRANAAAADARI